MANDDAESPPPKKRKHPAPLSYDSRVRLAKELLRHHPVIWDRKHPRFHTNSARDAAWLEVATKLGFELEVTRKEWKRFMNMHFTRHQRVTRGDTPARSDQLHQLLDGLFSKESAPPAAVEDEDDSSGDDEGVSEESSSSGPQCLLCLRWTTNVKLFDMFDDIGPAVAKIRSVLGIYLCEMPASRKICALCRQLVGLIDEFRTLCQLTNELGHERVRIRVLDSADAVGWQSATNKVAKVCDSVRLQQRLVERAIRGDDDGAGRQEDLEEPEECKSEVEEEEDRLKLSPIEIKEEEESSSSDSGSSSDEESSTEDDGDDETKLYEVYQVVGDDESVTIKSEPEDDGEDPCDVQGDTAEESNVQNDDDDKPRSPPPLDHKFTAEERLRFAQICFEHPIIWNRALADNHNSKMNARNAAWDAIAANFGIGREVAKLEYKRLRNIHQGRGSRLAAGELRPDDYLIVDPLFPLLCKMMGAPAAFEANRKTTREPPVRRQQRKRPDGKRTERNRIDYQWSLRFAREIEKLEPFWNVHHADHTRPTMTKLLVSLATTMNADVATIRREWKRFGEMHRRKLMGQAHGRKARTLKNANAKEPDPLQALLDKFFAYKTLESGGDRFSIKPRFDSDGCIAQQRRGITRYVKVCEECGKHVERSLFEAHMNRHRGVKPYECRFEGCEGRYTTRVNRDRHENIYHTREGFDIECDACGERFKHKSSLSFHYAVRHKSENVPCGICQKVFKHDRHLDFHMQKQHSVKLSNYRKSIAARKG